MDSPWLHVLRRCCTTARKNSLIPSSSLPPTSPLSICRSPLVFAYAAGFSELIGSWLVILGLLTPLGALALTGTMAVAAYQHILTAGFNIYVLELVVLYLGGSLALLLVGPGRFSFDAGMVAELLAAGNTRAGEDDDALSGNGIQPAYVPVSAAETSRFSRGSQ